MKKERAEFGADRPVKYVILVRGLLPERWQAWFEGMQIKAVENDRGEKRTILSGPVKDQAALFGILERIRDLGLPLLEVHNYQEGFTAAFASEAVDDTQDKE